MSPPESGGAKGAKGFRSIAKAIGVLPKEHKKKHAAKDWLHDAIDSNDAKQLESALEAAAEAGLDAATPALVEARALRDKLMEKQNAREAALAALETSPDDIEILERALDRMFAAGLTVDEASVATVSEGLREARKRNAARIELREAVEKRDEGMLERAIDHANATDGKIATDEAESVLGALREAREARKRAAEEEAAAQQAARRRAEMEAKLNAAQSIEAIEARLGEAVEVLGDDARCVKEAEARRDKLRRQQAARETVEEALTAQQDPEEAIAAALAEAREAQLSAAELQRVLDALEKAKARAAASVAVDDAIASRDEGLLRRAAADARVAGVDREKIARADKLLEALEREREAEAARRAKAESFNKAVVAAKAARDREKLASLLADPPEDGVDEALARDATELLAHLETRATMNASLKRAEGLAEASRDAPSLGALQKKMDDADAEIEVGAHDEEIPELASAQALATVLTKEIDAKGALETDDADALGAAIARAETFAGLAASSELALAKRRAQKMDEDRREREKREGAKRHARVAYDHRDETELTNAIWAAEEVGVQDAELRDEIDMLHELEAKRTAADEAARVEKSLAEARREIAAATATRDRAKIAAALAVADEIPRQGDAKLEAAVAEAEALVASLDAQDNTKSLLRRAVARCKSAPLFSDDDEAQAALDALRAAIGACDVAVPGSPDAAEIDALVGDGMACVDAMDAAVRAAAAVRRGDLSLYEAIAATTPEAPYAAAHFATKLRDDPFAKAEVARLGKLAAEARARDERRDELRRAVENAKALKDPDLLRRVLVEGGGDDDDVAAAREALSELSREREIRDALKSALESRDADALKQAIASADSFDDVFPAAEVQAARAMLAEIDSLDRLRAAMLGFDDPESQASLDALAAAAAKAPSRSPLVAEATQMLTAAKDSRRRAREERATNELKKRDELDAIETNKKMTQVALTDAITRGDLAALDAVIRGALATFPALPALNEARRARARLVARDALAEYARGVLSGSASQVEMLLVNAIDETKQDLDAPKIAELESALDRTRDIIAEARTKDHYATKCAELAAATTSAARVLDERSLAALSSLVADVKRQFGGQPPPPQLAAAEECTLLLKEALRVEAAVFTSARNRNRRALSESLVVADATSKLLLLDDEKTGPAWQSQLAKRFSKSAKIVLARQVFEEVEAEARAQSRLRAAVANRDVDAVAAALVTAHTMDAASLDDDIRAAEAMLHRLKEEKAFARRAEDDDRRAEEEEKAKVNAAAVIATQRQAVVDAREMEQQKQKLDTIVRTSLSVAHSLETAASNVADELELAKRRFERLDQFLNALRPPEEPRYYYASPRALREPRPPPVADDRPTGAVEPFWATLGMAFVEFATFVYFPFVWVAFAACASLTQQGQAGPVEPAESPRKLVGPRNVFVHPTNVAGVVFSIISVVWVAHKSTLATVLRNPLFTGCIFAFRVDTLRNWKRSLLLATTATFLAALAQTRRHRVIFKFQTNLPTLEGCAIIFLIFRDNSLARLRMRLATPDHVVYDVSKYDLTHKIAPFLDGHLVFPLLEFLEENTSYDKGAVQRARLALLSPTNMIDYAIEIHAQLTGEAESPPEMAAQLQTTLEAIKTLETKTQKTRELLECVETVETLKRDGMFTAAHLLEQHEITGAMLDEYYDFAKFLYECGDYQNARDMLDHYLGLNAASQSSPTSMSTRYFQALWGKLASEVLLKNWDDALADLTKLKQVVDERNSPPLEQLQQRSWLLHWSLFVFFNHGKGHDGIIDLFLSEKYLQAIQTNCPWLLRYLTTAVIINKRRRSTLKDLVRVVTQDSTEAAAEDATTPRPEADPVTRFVDCLYAKFDFDGAQQTLKECDDVLRADYFLCNCADTFMEVSFEVCFEVYCRIHTKIDIRLLATKLEMDDERAERWVVDLIRGALLDAKIDSKANCVIMGNQAPDVYSQVIEKTRDLLVRSNALINNIDQKILASDRKAAALVASSRDDRD
ncbi:hypothetical protein CTAYLR_005008 [Chrysophaeum taylorii]|uniref:Eukaryotic translation initiation factor 3 subunit E n=1 Tax=Chrysophaeum taylorii TaxID=2483200 RepID=A0AAD7XH90_9STRA|nr:hypothetical protein CTAYLR_005008 [Chrysophaeum taylorii]